MGPFPASESRGPYHGGRRPSSDDSFHSPTVIPPSALDKPSFMKRDHRRRTCSHTSPRRSPTMVTLHDTRFVECRWWNGGWTEKTVVTWRSSTSMIPAPGVTEWTTVSSSCFQCRLPVASLAAKRASNRQGVSHGRICLDACNLRAASLSLKLQITFAFSVTVHWHRSHQTLYWSLYIRRPTMSLQYCQFKVTSMIQPGFEPEQSHTEGRTLLPPHHGSGR